MATQGMSPKNILVLGATSAIAQGFARLHAGRRDRLMLVGRDQVRLQQIADDLRARGAESVETMALDLSDPGDYAQAFGAMLERLGGFDMILVAYGILGDQTRAEHEPAHLQDVFQANLTSAAQWLSLGAAHFADRGRGTLIAISSVAGDRGRKKNYAYGAAKGGLSIFLAGLRHRLAGTDVSVLTVKPGFVDTPMTAHMEKAGPLWASPERVARDIDKAVRAKKEVVYTPWFWRWIMVIIRLLPSAIFNRLDI